MRRLTEAERVVAALAWAQSQKCGYWYAPCDKPRAQGDHLCEGHRREMDARWKAIFSGGESC